MDTSKLNNIKINNKDSNVVGISYMMVQNPNKEQGKLYLKLDNSDTLVHKGTILGVSVFYGSPFNDIITFDGRQNAVIKEIDGRNTYIMYMENIGGRYTHTIEDDSDKKATIKFDPEQFNGRFTKENLKFSKEANTIVVYYRRDGGTAHGKIILKRKDGYQGTHFKIEIPATSKSTEWKGNLEELAGNEVGTTDGFNMPVFGIPYKYFMNQNLMLNRDSAEKCSFFLLDLSPPDQEPSTGEVKRTLEFFFSNSYVKISNSLMEKLKNENYVLQFERNPRTNFFYFEKRESKDSERFIYRITLEIPTRDSMKAILVGDMGSQKVNKYRISLCLRLKGKTVIK